MLRGGATRPLNPSHYVKRRLGYVTRRLRKCSGLSRARRWTTTHTHTSSLCLLPTHSCLISTKRYMSSENDSSQWVSSLSKRQMADLEDFLSRTVGGKVRDPVLDQDLASLKWIHPRMAVSGDGTIQILLKLPTILHPQLEDLKHDIRQTAMQEIHAWLESSKLISSGVHTSAVKVNVEAIATKPVPMMARLVEDREELVRKLGPGLANVSHFVAVYSCKGGVGKSTVAVNLAYELASMGGRIGLLDLDIYGPSLPVLVHPEDPAVRPSPKGPGMVYPIEHCGVKLLSLAFVSRQSGVPGSGQDNGAAVMRGPMAGKVVAQLLKGTDWGDLDVLLLDMPPGTGDVQLAVLQELQLSGAVAVTTPSKLAVTDTRKGIEMFTSLGVPHLAVVENLAFFEAGGKLYYPFGRGLAGEDPSFQSFDKSKLVQLPISLTANTANDSGTPFCLERPSDAEKELAAFRTLAKVVSGELMKYQHGRNDDRKFVALEANGDLFDLSAVTLSLDKSHGEAFIVRLFSDTGAVQKRLSPAKLRSRDPKTGETIADSPFLSAAEGPEDDSMANPMVTVHKVKSKQSLSLLPTKVDRKGRYGFSVEWADGATIIYSSASIARAAGGTLVK